MNSSERSRLEVEDLIRQVRRRWRRRAVLRGSAVTLMAAMLLATTILVLQRWPAMPPAVLLAVGALGVGLVGYLVVRFVAHPALRRITDEDIALFVEERVPDLEDRLNSAVEVGGQPRIALEGNLVEHLLADGARLARDIELSDLVNPRRERVLAAGTGLLGALFLFFALTWFDDVRQGIVLAAQGVGGEAPFLVVRPGSAEIEEGATQDIVAEFREEVGDDVLLHYRLAEGDWQRVEMTAGLDTRVRHFELESLQDEVEYFVQSGETRSDVFRLSLTTFPDVQRIDLTYAYPAYTGVADYREEDMGDIRGLKGSRVQIDIETTGPAERGELVLDDGSTVPLTRTGMGRFSASLQLERDGAYTVRLRDDEGRTNRFPEEYRITALDDLKPTITITDPQRDVRVNAVEEVLVAVRVTDDFGVNDVQLRYAVNGEDEQAASLGTPDSLGRREVDGSHLFYLEDYELQPGDVISYYVEARDGFNPSPESSDMYFIEVIPYDQSFRQAANMGGAPMAGQPSQIVMSQQQIIAATWKLIRDQETTPEGEYRASVETLAQAQATLRANIEQRINSTSFSFELLESEESKQVVALLRAAAAEMEGAVRELTAARLREALTPERRALTQLLRADALNKERQVAMNQQGQGSGSSATEERMTELMDLELDISKDKYEMQQQRSGGRESGPEDEALRKLQELARKQQNLANQMRRDLPEEEQKRQIERLKRDQDEIRRQAEQLSRGMRQQSSQGSAAQRAQEQMDQVIDNMRRAEQALRRGDVDESMARQRQATNGLQRLQQGMQRRTNEGMRERLQQTATRFRQVQEDEKELDEELARAERESNARGSVDPRVARDLAERRDRIAENIRSLDRELDDLSEGATGDQREVGRAARNLRQQLQRESIEEMMNQSRLALEQGWLEAARRLEDEIQRGLDRVGERVDDLAGKLPVSDEEQLARSLEEIQDLMDRLEQLQSATGSEGSASNQPGGEQGGRSSEAGMRRRLDQAREGVERLRQMLDGNARAQSLLQELSQNVGRADHTGVLLGDDAEAFFEDRIFSPLSALEQELLRQLDIAAMDKKLFGARKEEVPSQYRKLVEKYYETLAKSKR